MVRKQGCFRACVLATLVMVGLLAATSADAQLSTDAAWAELTNRYIGVDLGASGSLKMGSADLKIPGRWMVYTIEGDPDTTRDNRHPLVYFPVDADPFVPCSFFGFFKVKVGAKVYMIGDSTAGNWTKDPYAYTTPPPGYGVGKTGGFIDSEWTIKDGTVLVAVRIRMSIVRDQARFEFTLSNKGTASQSVGLLMTGDVLVDDNCASGNSYIPGYGYIRSNGLTPKPYPQLLTGTAIPDYFDTYDVVETPVVVARNTLRLQDCVAPDYLVLGEYSELASANNWIPDDFKPDYLKPLNDLTWALCWAPRTLGAGAARKIITYYGVGAATSIWTYKVGTTLQQDQAVLAVEGPRSLKYDSTTKGQNDLNPIPFTVEAFVYNLATDPGPYDLDNVTVALYLPPGLELTTSAGNTPQKRMGRIPINSEALPATWQVQATGCYSGELEYFVTARAASGWQQVISRKVMVPATRKFTVQSGWQLVHVPFTFNNPATDHALSFATGSYSARYFDPSTGTGQYLPVRQLEPGQAFWLYVGSSANQQLARDAAIVGEEFGKQTHEQYVDVSPGWNMIGNPFVYPVYWGQVSVYNKVGNVTVSLDQAVKNNWLSKTLFSWIPQSAAYESFKDNDRLLLPWKGYWLKANYPITLVFRPSVPPASDVTANPGGS